MSTLTAATPLPLSAWPALAALVGRRRSVAWRAGLLRAAGVWLAALLGAILLDAALDLSPGLRLAIDAALLGGLAWLLLAARPVRVDPMRAALREGRQAERALASPGNPVVNALWLWPRARDPQAGLAGALAQRSVDRGQAALGPVRPEQVIGLGPVWGVARGVAAVVLIWLLVGMFYPRLLGGGLARLALPWGDRPPFSLTTFQVRWQPVRPQAGQDVTVEATLSGRLPEHAELVLLDSQGRPAHHLPMALTEPAGAGPAAGGVDHLLATAQLHGLRQEVTAYVRTDGGRSARFTIRPVSPPPATDPHQAGTPPDGNDSDSGGPNTGDTARRTRAATHELGKLGSAAEHLQAIARELLSRLAQDKSGELSPEMAAKLRALKARLDQQAGDAASLAAALRDLAEACRAAGGQADDLQALEDAARLLESLKLPGVAGRPMPDPGGRNPGGTTAQGAGSGGLASPADMADWLRELMLAAGQDAATLAQALGAMDTALSGVASGGGTQTTQPDGVTANPAIGTLVELTGIAGMSLDRAQAVMQATPPAYRDLVRAYFERLWQDDVNRPTGPGAAP